ncbi:hypothetical protein MNBD_PLANCTO02-212, partial [hydrothermal vent metagenome]
ERPINADAKKKTINAKMIFMPITEEAYSVFPH